MTVIWAVLFLVLAAAPSGAAVLENPTAGRLYSGVGVISGWKCQAGELTVRFNGGAPVPLLYGAERKDALDAGACDHDRVGFVTIWNWGNLGDGEHEAVAYDNGEEFSRATFTVGSTGEAFLKGVSRQGLLENFPAPGETTILEWNESTQHFEIRAALVFALSYWRASLMAPIMRSLLDRMMQKRSRLGAGILAPGASPAGVVRPRPRLSCLGRKRRTSFAHLTPPGAWMACGL